MSDARRTRLYEKDWKYVPAAETDIRKTFAKHLRQQQPSAKVMPIKREAKQ
jgi:hypothetical protein